MSRRTFVAIVVHVSCWAIEYVLWHLPFDMPIPLFVGLVAFLGAFSLVLICRDIVAYVRWSNTPFPDPAALAIQLTEEDERRRAKELEACLRKEVA